MKRMNGTGRGFTLIELLVVITIIGMLAAVLVPSIAGALKGAKKARAMSQIKDLDGAVKRYFAEYGKMPAPKNRTDSTTFNGSGDMLFTGADQARVIEVLINANSNQNPKQIVFLDLDPASFGVKTTTEITNALAKGTPYKDPWGDPNKVDGREYGILMDLNFDGIIQGTKYGDIRATVGVYSGGEKGDLDHPPYKTW